MAQFSEKWLQNFQKEHTRENQYSSHNTNYHGHSDRNRHHRSLSSHTKPLSKGGLQILDFHESWLEEMQLYKSEHNYQQHNSPIESGTIYVDYKYTASRGRPLTRCENSVVAIAKAAINYDKIIQMQNSNAKQQRVLKTRSKSRKRGSSITPITTTLTLPFAQTSVPISPKPIKSEPLKTVESPPKTTHVASTNTSGAKVKKSSKKAHKNSQTAHRERKRSSDDNKNKNETKETITSPKKIVVNNFHGHNMFNTKPIEDKSKMLNQNGLSKSAATAIETSYYAVNYLRAEGKNVFGPSAQSMANAAVCKLEGGGDRMAPLVLLDGIGDDPCAVIDNIEDYSDSDSEDEYVGFPLYLKEDGQQTQQSQHIRYLPQNDVFSTDSKEIFSNSMLYYQPDKVLSPSLFPNVPPYLNFANHEERGPWMPAALHRILKWKLSPAMPKIVKRVVLNSGFRIIKNTTDWMAVWERHMRSAGFRTIRSHQKYNHIPGSFRIGRKDTIWRSIFSNIKKFGIKEFGFMQRSYIMPDDLENLRKSWPRNASKLTKWIIKPPASARGTGIRIVNKWSQFPKDKPLVVQKYIERPLLINGNKFDMRLYVLVTSINPLRIYLYKDGLARFAAVKYNAELNHLENRCMHLTNYSINKFSQNYTKNEDINACQGHKWTLQSLWSCLEERGVNTKHLWATLRNLVIRAILSGESGLQRMFRQNVSFRYICYEMFGFDILLDQNLIPWLLEVNVSPSLHSELPLDLHIKGPLIQAILNTCLYQIPPKLTTTQQDAIREALNIEGPLCMDKRIFTTCLSPEEVRKHSQFTNCSIEYRNEYLDLILKDLLPDDIRCLIIAEDELARCAPLERIFPTEKTHNYLQFFEKPRYYNRLLDAWEYKYAGCREAGITLLKKLCEHNYHIQVPDAALEKEPTTALNEIDMMYQEKDDIDSVVPNHESKINDNKNDNDNDNHDKNE